MSASAEEYNVSELAMFGDEAYLETANPSRMDSTKWRLIPIGHYAHPLRSEPGARQKSTDTWWRRAAANAERQPRLQRAQTAASS